VKPCGAATFYAFNTHWDHRQQGSRQELAELVLRRISARRRPGLPVLLLGDVNAVLPNSALKTLTCGNLVDVWETVHPGARNSSPPASATRTSRWFPTTSR
jgi:endonuclease/exonuclease/phosphatase family metal-dependent hydrolase